jgi:hypothetical protein
VGHHKLATLIYVSLAIVDKRVRLMMAHANHHKLAARGGAGVANL